MAVHQGDRGIDVSNYQGTNINWQEVKSDNVTFAYVKATEGSASGTAYVSPAMNSQFKGALGVGLDVGLYHFARYISIADAIEEAKWFVSHIKNYSFTLPPALDLEQNNFASTQALLDATEAFLSYVEKELGSVAIYMTGGFYNELKSLTNKYAFWYADPASKIYIDKPLSSLFAWQDNWYGKVKGITGNVDMDIAGGNFFTVTNKNLHSVPAPTVAVPKPKPAPVVKKPAPRPVVPTTYTVRAGDSLSKIALRYGLTVAVIEAWNHIPDPNVIMVGQVLHLHAPQVVHHLYHVVHAGDTVSGLASYYKVTENDIVRWNNLRDKDTIYIGQRLRVK
jgi:lysozyme